VTKATADQMLKNQEIANVISALGIGGVDEPLDESQLRYKRIIILTDADVDGAHIRTLLLNFLFQYKPELFLKGYVYVGMPPLYKVESGKTVRYAYDDAELKKVTQQFGTAKYAIQRFKGLGEMNPEQLWNTAMDPNTRVLKKISVPSEDDAKACLERLMGAEVAPRKELIEANATRYGLMDLDV